MQIIDSDSSQSQVLSSSLQAQQGDSARLQQMPNNPNKEGVSLSGDKCMNVEYNLHQFWKKQIKIFFCCRKKCNRGKQLKKWPLWTTDLQNLLRCGLKKHVNKIHSKPALVTVKKYLPKPKTAIIQKLSLLSKPVKSCNFHLIILSSRKQNITKQSIVFDLEILNLNSRMVFKTINFSNCLDLKQQVLGACKLFPNSLVTVHEKQTFLNRLVENTQQIIEWAHNLEDLKTILTLEQKQVFCLSKQGKKNKGKGLNLEKTCEDIKKCIGKYLWLKREFQVGLQQMQDDRCFTQDDILVMSLAYNLLCCAVDPEKGEFQQQVKAQSSTILKLFAQANIKLNTISNLIKGNKGHFPFNLDNAHLCWGCKTKRIYTYCPTCTDLEGHTLALCNECYLPFHRERVRCIPNREEEFQNSLIEKWENFNGCISSLMTSDESNQMGMKKEENDSH